MLRENQRLECLALGYNRLLEEQAKILTSQQLEDGLQDIELSAPNVEIVSCLNDFIKRNINLVYLDLQATGLIQSALKSICSTLRHSLNLQSLHLSGNPGVSPSLMAWTVSRLKAHLVDPEPISIANCPT